MAASSSEDETPEHITLATAPDDVLLSVAHVLAPADVVALGRLCRCVASVLREILASQRAAAVQRVHDKCCECGKAADACQWAATLGAQAKLPCPLWTRSDHPRRWDDACFDSSDTSILMHLLRRTGAGERSDSALRTFALDQHPIACGGVRSLLRTLPEAAPALDVLSLDGCGIEDAGACALADAISDGLLRLRMLSLDENPFSTAGRRKLRAACRSRNVELSASQAVDNESLWE